MTSNTEIAIVETKKELSKAKREAVLFVKTAETEEDYKTARDAFKNIIKVGQESMLKLANVAADMENPKAFEHIGSLLSSIADAAERMIKLQTLMRDLEDRDKSSEKLDNMLQNQPNTSGMQPTMHIKDAKIFVGTTSEFLDQLYKGNNEPAIIDVSPEPPSQNVPISSTLVT